MKSLKTILLVTVAVIMLAINAQSQNLYVPDFQTDNVYEFTTNGAQSTFASGFNFWVTGLAFDNTSNLFVGVESGAIAGLGQIIKITPSGTQTAFASGLQGPSGLAFNSAGNLFETDWGSGHIYEFTTNGVQTTFASGLQNPSGLAFNSAGDLFVVDSSGHIYQFTTNGVQTTFASGLQNPNGLAFNSAGDLFVADSGSGNIYEFTTNGMQSTFASGLNYPQYLAFNGAGELLVGVAGGGNIYEFTTNGVQSTFASGLTDPEGLAFQGLTLPPAAPSITSQPQSVSANEGGIASFNVTASGSQPLAYQWLFDGIPIGVSPIITTVAGKYSLGEQYTGDGGAATSAGIDNAGGVAVDGSGNLYIADIHNSVIRKVDTNGVITTFAGNYYLRGGYSGDGNAATNAALNIPNGVASDELGNLYISDSRNNVIRKVNASGIITTVAGNHLLGGQYSGDGGPATNAALNYPLMIAVDGANNLFIAEIGNNVIRKVNASGMITTVAGNSSLGGGYTGDGGPATNAALSSPQGVALDGSGNLYISEGGNNVVRRVDAGGTITTVAGKYNLGGGYSGDGGLATNAALSNPIGLTTDDVGNLYIAEYGNDVIRKVDASGIITTIAGNHLLGGQYSGDGGPATNAAFYVPFGVALDDFGNLYIGDADNNVVRKVTAAISNASLSGSTLMITNVQNYNVGNYEVIVSNTVGAVTSSNAVLSFIIPPHDAAGLATLAYDFVVNVSLTDGGFGYTNTPLVRLIGGGGSGAGAYAVVSNGVVTSITVTNAGFGYTNVPLVVIEPPFIPNPVLSIAPMSFLTFSNLTLGGDYQLQQFQTWYWTNQPLSFTATNTLYSQMFTGVVGGGEYRLALNPVPSQAFATPVVSYGFVVSATVTSGGSGYITSPVVSIVGGGGTNATATSKISGGAVTGITITDAGIGYTNTPTVRIAAPPAAAVSPLVQPVMEVTSLNLAPYDDYQILFTPDLGAGWGYWGGQFVPTATTNSQCLFITNDIGYFRLQYVP